jgi:hypothetical protein
MAISFAFTQLTIDEVSSAPVNSAAVKDKFFMLIEKPY